MIFQLIKRDPLWRSIRWFASMVLIAGVAAFLIGTACCDLSGEQLPSFLLAGLTLGLAPWALFSALFMGSSRCTVFLLTLPISGRQLFCARILSLLAFIWTPAVVGSGLCLLFVASRATSAIPVLLQCAGIFTLALAIAQSLRIRDATLPRPALAVGIGALLLVVILRLRMGFSKTPLYLPPFAILALCAITAAFLIFWTWQRVPVTFQMRAASSRKEHKAEKADDDGHVSLRSSSLTARNLLKRPIFFMLPYTLIAFFPILTWGRDLYGGSFFLFFIILSGSIFSTSVFRRVEWMLPLPVSRRKLFAFMHLPVILLVAAIACLLPCFTRIPPIFRTPKAVLVFLGFTIAILELRTLLDQCSHWRPLGRIRRSMPKTWSWISPSGGKLIYFAIALFYLSLLMGWGSNSLIWLLGLFPSNWLWLSATLLIGCGVLYWAGELQFHELEIPPKTPLQLLMEEQYRRGQS